MSATVTFNASAASRQLSKGFARQSSETAKVSGALLKTMPSNCALVAALRSSEKQKLAE